MRRSPKGQESVWLLFVPRPLDLAGRRLLGLSSWRTDVVPALPRSTIFPVLRRQRRPMTCQGNQIVNPIAS